MTAASTLSLPQSRSVATPSGLWRTGIKAGVVAGAATVAVAVAAHQAGVSLETAPGEAIPAFAFGQLTVFFTFVGVVIARTLGRRARQPRATFVRTTVALTALSLVPDVMLDADVATKLTLIATHLVAAAIVIPALSARLGSR